jgi:MFS transporter, YNFM family, putative membrane transport protein
LRETAGDDVAAPRVLPGTREYARISIALFFAGATTFSLLYCVQPLLPLLAHDFAVGPAASSLSLSFTTASLAVAIVCAPLAAASFGRRGLMFVSLCGAALANIAVAATHRWPVLLALRTLEGIALGGVPGVAMAYIAEEMDPQGLGFSMGLYIAGTAFGGMAGRVCAGLLAQAASWRTALWVLGAAGVAAAAAFIALMPRARHRSPAHGQGDRRRAAVTYHLRAWSGHLHSAPLRRLFAIGFLVMGAFVTVYNYVGFRLVAPPYDFDQRQLGLIFIIYLFGIAASSAAGALADRIGPQRVLCTGIAITMLGVTVSLMQPLSLLLLGVISVTIGFFASHAVASGWIGRLATAHQGHASSLYLLAYYLGSSLAGSAGGWFWAAGGWSQVALFTLVLLALALAASVRIAALAAA